MIYKQTYGCTFFHWDSCNYFFVCLHCVRSIPRTVVSDKLAWPISARLLNYASYDLVIPSSIWFVRSIRVILTLLTVRFEKWLIFIIVCYFRTKHNRVSLLLKRLMMRNKRCLGSVYIAQALKLLDTFWSNQVWMSCHFTGQTDWEMDLTSITTSNGKLFVQQNFALKIWIHSAGRLICINFIYSDTQIAYFSVRTILDFQS